MTIYKKFFEDELSLLRDEFFWEKLDAFMHLKEYSEKIELFALKKDEKNLVFTCGRYYQMNEDDLETWADWCGYSSPEEAQAYYGEPDPKYVTLTIKIPLGFLETFRECFQKRYPTFG